jgi:glyoxylase-like metal-dependent hydrolase (beta-lactamase superfamily II)
MAGVAAFALGLTAGQSRGAAPLVGKQAPGFYRYKVGEFELTVVTDGARTAPLPDGLVKNARKSAIADALGASFMDRDRVTSQFTPIVVNTGAKLIVIDTGWGEAQLDTSKTAIGQFNTNLSAASIDRASVDVVIISHCHGDHLNGLLTKENALAFPNAEILIPAAEWRFWNDAGTASRLPAGTTAESQFKNNQRVFGILNSLGVKPSLYEADRELASGIRSLASPGHTPGHMSHVISSGSSTVFVQADIANGPLFARYPGWHSMFDMDGGMAETTRRRIYDMLSTEKLLVQAFHHSFPALGYLERLGDGYRLAPVPWAPLI